MTTAIANISTLDRPPATHPAVDHPRATLGEGHQVDFVVAAFAAPGNRPARRARLVAHLAAATELLLVDAGELVLNERIEGNEELEQLLAVVVDPPLELKIRLGDRHPVHDTFSPRFPQIGDKSRP